MSEAAAPGERVQELLQAVRSGAADEVQRLVQADPALAEARDQAGVSAVLIALYHGHEPIARWLVARRRSLDVFEAAALGDRARLRDALEDDTSLVSRLSPDGFTALALASFFGRLEIVRDLLARGADPNAASPVPPGYNPLTGAVAGRHEEVVAELLRRGANPNHRYGPGYTPLHAAAASGSVAVLRLLVQAGADVGALNDEGRTPRELALEKGATEAAELLGPQASAARPPGVPDVRA
jgi:ankyrin repeat protein